VQVAPIAELGEGRERQAQGRRNLENALKAKVPELDGIVAGKVRARTKS